MKRWVLLFLAFLWIHQGCAASESQWRVYRGGMSVEGGTTISPSSTADVCNSEFMCNQLWQQYFKRAMTGEKVKFEIYEKYRETYFKGTLSVKGDYAYATGDYIRDGWLWDQIGFKKKIDYLSLESSRSKEREGRRLEQEAKKVPSLSKPDSSISADYQKVIGHWRMEGESMVIEEMDNDLFIQMDRIRGYHRDLSGQVKYKETTYSQNISWDGKHLEFEIWMPSGAGGYEVFYSLTLQDRNTLSGTKQASGSPTKIEVEFKRR